MLFADSVVQRSPRMSGAKADAELRSKTDNLERMITEVEKLSGSDSGSNGIGGGREVKKYIRWVSSNFEKQVFINSR